MTCDYKPSLCLPHPQNVVSVTLLPPRHHLSARLAAERFGRAGRGGLAIIHTQQSLGRLLFSPNPTAPPFFFASKRGPMIIINRINK